MRRQHVKTHAHKRSGRPHYESLRSLKSCKVGLHGVCFQRGNNKAQGHKSKLQRESRRAICSCRDMVPPRMAVTAPHGLAA